MLDRKLFGEMFNQKLTEFLGIAHIECRCSKEFGTVIGSKRLDKDSNERRFKGFAVRKMCLPKNWLLNFMYLYVNLSVHRAQSLPTFRQGWADLLYGWRGDVSEIHQSHERFPSALWHRKPAGPNEVWGLWRYQIAHFSSVTRVPNEYKVFSAGSVFLLAYKKQHARTYYELYHALLYSFSLHF